jgi:PAP_fibrillin
MATTRKITTLWTVLWLCLVHHESEALQNLFALPKWMPTSANPNVKNVALEDELLAAIAQSNRRLDENSQIQTLIEQLEGLPSIAQPAIAPQIYGVWRLVYSSSAATSSPIQRRAVNAQQFPIYQDIVLSDSTGNDSSSTRQTLVVKQIVKFAPNFILSVDALASTAAYPLSELTEPRRSTGKVLGFNVLGVSLVGAEAEPNPIRPNSRIDFVFDEGTFTWDNRLTVPYPVPFRAPWFRDWVKGWIDITYLSDRLRISRGNKGTTFVLVKEDADKN